MRVRLPTLFLAGAPIVSFANGPLEINQTCALTSGCFPGDSAGFPVTITTSGSDRLTGSLDLRSLPGLTAIQISAPATKIDLGGIAIVGPTVCSGFRDALSCAPLTGGNGVELFSSANGSGVSNGMIRGMGGNGISGNASTLRIRNVTAMHCGNDGISATGSTLVTVWSWKLTLHRISPRGRGSLRAPLVPSPGMRDRLPDPRRIASYFVDGRVFAESGIRSDEVAGPEPDAIRKLVPIVLLSNDPRHSRS